ncbi:MAG: metalloprotease PmbA [Litorivicinaceae bacterium]|nr:metalloprotease PmbA [Gammaproteobacteria bacterium]RPG20116.1 MAG: metalloprotease PmbA [Oceanospirillales bacterium TMED33]RZO77596.1 MAG: metalloprotease PmbA [Litorivicinaceae bacterium]CAI8270792.1 MAG: Metalloprotease PmbA [Gammaproteobacteria bacterium]
MPAKFNSQQEKNRLEELTIHILEQSKRVGADACEVAASASVGLDVQARLGQPEKLEMTRDQSLSVTLFLGESRGSASTTDLSDDALQSTLEAALAIAKVTASDPAAVLGPRDQIIQQVPNLELDHQWNIDAKKALELAIEVESFGRQADSRITNSEGGSVSSTRGVSVHGTTEGLLVSQPTSIHGMSCVLLAEDGDSRERSYAYTQSRRPDQLWSPEVVGRQAAEKTVARLNPRKCMTAEIPVLFIPETASGLLSSFVSAISGGSLYRKSSYLLDRLGTDVFPSWVSLSENPIIPGAMGSSAYDSDGLPTREQAFVTDGVLSNYVLSLYSANRLGLQSTHNAGGVRNLWFKGDKEFDTLVAEMGRGLIVTELMGQGVNLVNGDYSRGASGFWVENGEIAYPVHEVTVASNLDRMLQHDLVGAGSDIDLRRSIAAGSMLFEKMMVAGS